MQTSAGVRAVTACRVCEKADWQEVIDFGPVPLAGGFLEPADSYDGERSYPLGLISCRSCRLLSLTHVVDPEILYRIYPYTTSDSETITRHMAHVVDACLRRFKLPPDSLVVELGSNIGTQLMAFRQEGMRVLGIDPAENITAVANECGIETWPEFFSLATSRQVEEKHGTARLVLGRHVFAHIDDLAGTVMAVREILSPDGIFAIEVPYALNMLDANEFDTVYHEHLSYFFIGAFAALFRRYGLHIIDVERVPVHGGSVLVFVGNEDGPWPASPTVGELLALEQQSKVYEDATYHRFAERVGQVRDELTALVGRIADTGSRIAGYGAPAKGNTLLNVCGLGLDELEFCCDTTPFKQGKVLPGTHVPVRDPGYAKAHPPDFYLLLAWNYAEEILRKEQAFLNNGGRFIIPVPKPSIAPSGCL